MAEIFQPSDIDAGSSIKRKCCRNDLTNDDSFLNIIDVMAERNDKTTPPNNMSPHKTDVVFHIYSSRLKPNLYWNLLISIISCVIIYQ